MTSDEVVSTIQFYDDSQPTTAVSTDAQPRLCYVVGNEAVLLDVAHSSALRLSAIPLNWEPLLSARFGSARPDVRTLPIAALPALAGVMEA
jgi:hypothetical protein